MPSAIIKYEDVKGKTVQHVESGSDSKTTRRRCGRVRSRVHVHYTDIDGDGYRMLREAERVTFQIVQVRKGPQVANVVKGASD